MLKKIFVVLAIALAIILVLCWIYLPSFSRYHELKQEEEKLTKRIREIDSQIRALTDEKFLLQNDVAYLEKVIREELGFVKPGEIIYEMVTKKGGDAALVEAGQTEQSAGGNSTVTAAFSKTSTPKVTDTSISKTPQASSASTISPKKSKR